MPDETRFSGGHFPPLTAEELASRARTGRSEPATSSSDQWQQIRPVPPDAPNADLQHPRLGRPIATWVYRDANGDLLGYVARFEGPDGKQVLPFTYRQGPRGQRQWRWAGFAEPCPLYGADRLPERPHAPVLVVEGEKTADAAARHFPDYVVITSPGGANAAGKADWLPLAGSRVVIWPDHDEPGRQYAERVSALALLAGAVAVAVVAVPAEFPDHWDLADPLPDAIDADDLAALLSEAQPLPVPVPAASHPRQNFPYRQTPEGIYWRDPDPDKPPLFLCGPVEVLAKTRDDDSRSWGLHLRWEDGDGVAHQWAMAASLLAGEGAEIWSHLLDRGLQLASSAKARVLLKDFLATVQPDGRARCVGRIGWQASCFVLPNETFGDSGDECILLQTLGSPDHAFHLRGTLESWQQSVARYAIGNSRLTFAISVAFAAPLLELTGAESGGFHMRGGSSTGKTTTLADSGSVWGGGGLNGYISQWRATDNGLEAIAAMHCDALLCLDELSQVDARAAGQVAYMLANGSGKARAGRSGESRTTHKWRLLFLSTGEISLADKIAEDGGRGRRPAAGQQVRVVDLPADAGAGLGVFEDLHGFPSGDALARHLKTAAREHYGVAISTFLRELSQRRGEIVGQLVADRDAFVFQRCPRDADGQVSRVAARFGLVAAAGELATAWGVVPWAAGEATRAAVRCFQTWLEARGGIEPAEITDGVRQVVDVIEVHGSSRFEDWPVSDIAHDLTFSRRTANRLGWRRKDVNGRWQYYATVAGFAEMTRGFDKRLIAAALVDRGMLVPGHDGKTSCSVTVPGHTRQRLYHFRAEALADDEEGDRVPPQQGDDPLEEFE